MPCSFWPILGSTQDIVTMWERSSWWNSRDSHNIPVSEPILRERCAQRRQWTYHPSQHARASRRRSSCLFASRRRRIGQGPYNGPQPNDPYQVHFVTSVYHASHGQSIASCEGLTNSSLDCLDAISRSRLTRCGSGLSCQNIV